MKQKALILILYSIMLMLGAALIFFSGGAAAIDLRSYAYIIPFIISIALLLLFLATRVAFRSMTGYFAATFVLFMICLFFASRFYITGLFAPSGIGFLMTLGIFLYFLLGSNEDKAA